jgi:hypothetical protein
MLLDNAAPFNSCEYKIDQCTHSFLVLFYKSTQTMSACAPYSCAAHVPSAHSFQLKGYTRTQVLRQKSSLHSYQDVENACVKDLAVSGGQMPKQQHAGMMPICQYTFKCVHMKEHKQLRCTACQIPACKKYVCACVLVP